MRRQGGFSVRGPAVAKRHAACGDGADASRRPQPRRGEPHHEQQGLDADWFADHTELMSTDGARLISVTVHWSGATQPRARALAEALARTYLGQEHG